MRASHDVTKQALERLGKEALAVQLREGHGVWMIKPGTKPQYVSEKHVRVLIHGSRTVDDLMKMIENHDPAKQAVYIFERDNRQYIGIVTIEDEQLDE